MIQSNGATQVDRLRLTDTTALCETGYALYDVAQTTAAGLDISFNVSMNGYGGNSCPTNPSDNYNFISTGGAEPNSSNTCQADGLVFYLKNGSNTDTGANSLGFSGGSLGYSPLQYNWSYPGLSGALLGIGFDAYGNFYQEPFVGQGCPSELGHQEIFARRSLIVRGAQGADRMSGYCRIPTSNDRLNTDSSNPLHGRNSGVDLGDTSIFTAEGAKIRIKIDATDHSAGSNGTGIVYIAPVNTDTNSSGWNELTRFQLPSELVNSPTFKFGFVAGTGGGEMNSEIWDASVNSIRDIPNPTITSTSNVCINSGEQINQQIVFGQDGVAPYAFSVTSGSLPNGLSLNSSGTLVGSTTQIGDYSFEVTLSDASSSTTNPQPLSTSIQVASYCGESIDWFINGEQHVQQESSSSIESIYSTSNEPTMTIDESLLDDQESAAFHLEKSINFGTHTYTDAYVSTNARIYFGDPETWPRPSIEVCPNDWWTELESQGPRTEDAYVSYGGNSFGFVAEWKVRPYGDSTSETTTCKVVITYGENGGWLGEIVSGEYPDQGFNDTSTLSRVLTYEVGGSAFTAPFASNVETNSVEARNSRGANIDLSGTMVQQSTDYTNETCGQSWNSYDWITVSGTPQSTDLTTARAKCFRWTFDPALDGGAVIPHDTTDQLITRGLTSPILIVPAEALVTYPSQTYVDPRTNSITLPRPRITGPDHVKLCYYQSDSSSLAGIGAPSGTSTLTFTGTAGTRNFLSFDSAKSDDASTSEQITITNTSGNFTSERFVLIRALPSIPGFAASCVAGTNGLYPIESGAQILKITPLALNGSNTVTVPIGRQ